MKWFLLVLLAAYAAGEVVVKEDGIMSQRVSSNGPWAGAGPSVRVAGEDSSEHGVSPGSKSTSCKCGWANRSGGSRIVGGTYYNANEYPFIAGVAKASWGGYAPFCGGSIITANHVITAAHCTENIVGTATQIAVMLGTHNRAFPVNGDLTIPVTRISQHEGYNPTSLVNDISILTLHSTLNFNSIIGPVCMPQPGLDVTGKTVRILGWGAERFKGPMTKLPKKMDTTVISANTCSTAWSGFVSANNPTQICTHSKIETACQGDSGGPVVWLDPQTNRYTLVGLVSFGPKCVDDRPTVHTMVTNFLPWINKQIAATKPSATCQKS